jgi:hypothetical protein
MDDAYDMQACGITDVMHRSQVVLANADRRAAALRGQVADVTIAEVEGGSGGFSVGNYYFPEVNPFWEDLDMRLLLVPATYWNKGCLVKLPAEDCETPMLSNELYYLLDPAQLIILDDGLSDIPALKTDPLFERVPAVKKGDYVVDPGETRAGALVAAWDYDLVENALKIDEYHATVTAGVGAQASLTLWPAKSRACWSISPTPGRKRPAGPIRLSVLGVPETRPRSGSTRTLTLAVSPRYVPSERIRGWNTDPVTYETNGCVRVPTAVAHAWEQNPSRVDLDFGGGQASVIHGDATVLYSTSP